MYAIVDIETTGGSLHRGRITEVAIYVHNGQSIVKEFQSLINPESNIPERITQLTGISNEMVATAPKFYEVGREIVEATEGCIFVAHNVNFDYRFIREEFKRLGYDWRRPKLCTVQLSRRLIPGLPSYSLGKLCASLDIPLTDRHRAAGDAKATTLLFELLLQKDQQGIMQRQAKGWTLPANLPPHFDPNSLDDLPDATGVYYLRDQDAHIIYVGKSKHIRQRLLTHLKRPAGRKARSLWERIATVDWQLTGSELVALLLESAEIKKYRPFYNSQQIRHAYPFALTAHQEIDGYWRLAATRIEQGTEALAVFTTQTEARKELEKLALRFGLCKKLLGLEKGTGPCFGTQLKSCQGACQGLEPAATYNERVQAALAHLKQGLDNCLVLDRGRTQEELAVIQVQNGRYVGFGYTEPELAGQDPESLLACVEPYPDNRDVRRILYGFLRRNTLKVIPLAS